MGSKRLPNAIGGSPALTTIIALSLLGASVAGAQPPVETVTVRLSSFRFDPAEIRLVHGHRYAFHFTNASGGGHDFVAKSFFAAALSAPDRARLLSGEVGLDGHEEATVLLVAPTRGVYEFHCSHFLHQTLGMKGRIVVE